MVLYGYGAFSALPLVVLGFRQVDVRGVREAKGQRSCRVEEAEDDVVDDVAAVCGRGRLEMGVEGAETVDRVCGGGSCRERDVGCYGWVVRQAGYARC